MMAGRLANKDGRRLNVRPDTLDFRDLMFVPTLVEVPIRLGLEDYLQLVKATLARMLGSEELRGDFGFKGTRSSLRLRRETIAKRS